MLQTPFLLHMDEAPDGDALKARFDRYYRYLESIKTALPDAAYAFATASWHYDPRDPRCPHDSWIDRLTITERAEGVRSEQRTLEVHLRLLGAYHNGHIELVYTGVDAYHMERQHRIPTLDGHGDWLIDEIGLSEHGLVIHEIQFAQAHIAIMCQDVTYAWNPYP